MYIGYFQYCLVLMLVAMVVLDKFGAQWRSKAVAAVALPIIGIVPLSGIPVAGYLLGVFGQLSISSTIILGAALVGHISKNYQFSKSDRIPIYVFVGLIGLFFYPMALGVTQFDPYRFGYDSLILIATMMVGSVIFWCYGFRFLAFCILLAMVAFNLQILESNNYWDYLFDIYLFFTGIGFIVVYLVNRIRYYSSTKPMV